MADTNLEIFVRQVRERSRENSRALALLHDGGLQANVVSILRQELDSLVRVIFLLAQTDRAYRAELVTASVEGRTWTKRGGRGRITDREMVELTNSRFAWAKNVYEFGCAFIHLSSFHDYASREPMEQISATERRTIACYLNQYHLTSFSPTVTFSEIIPYLPSVFKKITDNLDYHLKDLEEGRDLD